MILWELFIVFLQIGAFSFGGGYAAMPLIQNLVVSEQAWLSAKEFTELLTISQMTPGPIAVNAATFVGFRMAGLLGAVIATFGVVFPSLLLVTGMAIIYNKYRRLDVLQNVLTTLRPAVVAMIATAALIIIISVIWPEGKMSMQGRN